MDDTNTGRALVVGAGIAGIRAALDLAETGYDVLLTESSPAVGGILSKLDFQFPTDHCGMCRMLPFVGRESASQFCMRKSLFHDGISIRPNTEVVACQGEPGRFEVTLRTRAQRVDDTICIGDGECAAVCPVEVSDGFNEGFTPRKAIYRPVPHNLPNHWVIDPVACTDCGDCVRVCPVNAIDLEAQDTEETVTVGAVVLATGAGLFDPTTPSDFYNYGASPHVVTSLEFERLLSGTGTYHGDIRRPADGKEAKRIAWIQCVGSRNRRLGRDFCSSVCCMFALKEAVLAKERGGPDTDAVIFYMDLRTFGKDYYRYRETAERDHGVRTVRCRPQSVHPNRDGDPVIRYFDADGHPREETFDLVVLATGQTPPVEASALQRVFGFSLNTYGFAETSGNVDLSTSTPGVFVCGSFTGLKDISDALVQGSAAAAEVGALLCARGLLPRPHVTPPPARDVSREEPRVAVILCQWPRSEGGQPVDFQILAREVAALEDVSEVHVVEEVCRAGADKALEILKASAANRVLFAACLPYKYKRGLMELAELAGFNGTLINILDLRSELRRAAANGNGRSLDHLAISRLWTGVRALCARDPVDVKCIPVARHALVVGGGLAGMQAALTVARHGVPVTLVERSPRLGGHALDLRTTVEGMDPAALVERVTAEVVGTPEIRVLVESEVLSSSGSVGQFQSVLRMPDGSMETMVHGATILATGGMEAPAEGAYLHGTHDGVLTQEALEQALADGSLSAENLGTVVMIQCVGSREAGHREYCSRLCCSSALKNARRILELNPSARVMVLYRDMMTYGFKEVHYSAAREWGVVFSTYSLDKKPVATLDEGRIAVSFTDEILGEEVTVHPDLLVLSTGVVPRDQSHVAKVFGVNTGESGFLEEADYKFRPVEMLKEGITVCGLAHSPRSMTESMTMAAAAGERALTVLMQDVLTTARLISRVRQAACAVCELCVHLCPYQARRLDPAEGVIVVDPLACQGCGICTAACPSSAAVLTGQAERQIMASLDAELCSLAVR